MAHTKVVRQLMENSGTHLVAYPVWIFMAITLDGVLEDRDDLRRMSARALMDQRDALVKAKQEIAWPYLHALELIGAGIALYANNHVVKVAVKLSRNSGESLIHESLESRWPGRGSEGVSRRRLIGRMPVIGLLVT